MQKPEDIPKEAWSAAKLAVRAYARDPAEINASGVAIASQEIRQLDVSSLWRQMQCRLAGQAQWASPPKSTICRKNGCAAGQHLSEPPSSFLWHCYGNGGVTTQ